MLKLSSRQNAEVMTKGSCNDDMTQHCRSSLSCELYFDDSLSCELYFDDSLSCERTIAIHSQYI